MNGRPRPPRFLALERAVLRSALRFLLGGWRRTTPPGFTYHRNASLRLLLPALPLIALGDVALLELVLLRGVPPWGRIAAHALAAYGLLWLLGVWASFRTLPHVVEGGRVLLRRGLLRHVVVPLETIASVQPQPTFRDDWALRAYRRGAIRLDVSGPTVLELRLRAPVQPVGALGSGPASDRLLVSVDDPDAFLAALGLAPAA